MIFLKNVVVLILPLFFATSCLHVHHRHDGPYDSRGQRLESQKSCKSRCMDEFHACKDRRGKGKGGASKCAHRKNACKSRC